MGKDSTLYDVHIREIFPLQFSSPRWDQPKVTKH